MVKRLSNWLKIGVQAGFGPNFTVEFEAEIPKKLGWPTAQRLGLIALFVGFVLLTENSLSTVQ